MTVIYSNCGDTDTALLTRIWEGIPDVTVIEITRDSVDYEDVVDEAIANEEDTILFCGHGSSHGLLHPNFSEYILHELNCHLIHARRVIGVWCYASDFARTQHLRGFFTSMYISNLNEAYTHGYTTALATEIEYSLRLFTERLNTLIINEEPMDSWYAAINNQLDTRNEVEVFNYHGLRYYL